MDIINNDGAKIVIDYVYGVFGVILFLLLIKFGCDVVVFNVSL